MFVVTARLTVDQTLEERHVYLAAPVAAGDGPSEDFADWAGDGFIAS